MTRFSKDLLVGAVLGAAFLGAALAADGGHIPFAGPAKVVLYPPEYEVRSFAFDERAAGAAVQAAGREHALTVRARTTTAPAPAPSCTDCPRDERSLADLTVDAEGNLIAPRTATPDR